MIGAGLALAARHGRLCLVAGLIAGLALPMVAAALRPWLPQLIGLLLFFTAVRIGPRNALGSLKDLRGSATTVLGFQLLLPLAVVSLLSIFGVATVPLALAVSLMLAAPSVSGAPNFTILLGHDPAPAMRLLIVGTALFPLTVLPVLWMSPVFADAGAILTAGARLFGVIALAVGSGFAVRAWALPDLADQGRSLLDGLSAITLAVAVVGLMSAVGPALADTPVRLLGWLGAAFAVNFALQGATRLVLGRAPATAATGVVAGNRNVALFLIALPEEVSDQILIFIGCYQVPMYLTPILLRRLYGPADPSPN